ncbi:Sds3-like-domain-containing protein [Umbelopsis sp. PMI_123]|nr:Sds3-like-domain-containing protein [Umbelopsis sp. PMI_123]
MDWSQTDALASSRRRNSSKLSLGSTPSSPISTDAADDDDGDAPLTPTERLVDDEDEDEDDAMLSLNGVLSTDEKDDDDEHALRNSSPSTLSSVPDDFPLSRSSSPITDPHPENNPTDVVNNKNESPKPPVEEDEEKLSQDDDEENEEDNQKPQPSRRRTRSRRTGRRTRKRKIVREEEEEQPSEVPEERKSRNGKVSKPDNDPPSNDSDSGSGRAQRKRPKFSPMADDNDKEEEEEDDPTGAETEDTSHPIANIKEEEDDAVHPDSTITNGEANNDVEEYGENIKKSADPEDDDPPHTHEMEDVSPAVGPEDEASGAEDEEGEDQPPQPDDHEYQKSHKEALLALTHIEVEFARLRETMYQEKMAELKEEMTLITDGTHPELVSLMEEIESKKRKRMDTAAAWCRYQQLNYRRQFEGFEYQANVHFIHKKNALRRDMINGLNDKRWKLDEERAKLGESTPLTGTVPDRTTLTRHKKLQKAESLELRHIQHALGFPLAPNVLGVGKKDIDDDLEMAKKLIEEDLEALGLTHKAMISSTEATPGGSILPTAVVGPSERLQGRSDNGEHPIVEAKHLDYPNGSNVISPPLNSNPIYIQQGKLQYHNHTFNKGDHLTVVDVNAGRYTAKMLVAHETEIVIQRTDGSKTRLPLAMICEGKYQISTKS